VAAEVEKAESIAARSGYIAFETFGRNESITHLELLPFVQADRHTLFSDLRLFMSNEALFGGNIGFGYRFEVPEQNRFYGASIWYDLDDTTGDLFHQIGLSLETYGTHWDLRSNFYFPIADQEKDSGLAVQNQQFVGNRIIYDRSRTFGEAMEGLDLELGVLLPTEIAARHDLRAYAGWYCFLGDAVPDIYGYRIRLEGYVTDNLALQGEMTDDRTFGTTATLGVAFTFPGRSQQDKSCGPPLRRRNSEFIRRNYNIIVSKQEDLQTGLTAINPSTGQPYVVQHVSSAAGGLNLGTVEDPFHAIAEAQAADGDLVFVHAGSVLNDSLILQPRDRILGEGVDHWISYGANGNHLLPTATGGAIRPTLQAVAGTAVTLASHSRFSGFIIDGPSGSGIVGSSVEDVEVAGVDVVNADGDGVLLQDSGDRNALAGVNITGASGAALHVDGGTADVAFSGRINNSTGRALVVENTAGGTVDLSGTTINDDGGEGVLLANANGAVSLGEVNLRNSTTAGVAVQGGAGAFSIGKANIENPAGAGLQAENATGSIAVDTLNVDASAGGPGVSIVDSPAETSFGDLDVSTENSTGLFARDSGPITIGGGTIAATGGSAVDIENTEKDISLTSVSSDGAAIGVRIVDSAGSFTVAGNADLGTGGLIRNAGTGVLLHNAGSVTFQYLDLDTNGIGIDAANTEYLCLKHGRLVNSAGYAVDSLNVGTFEVYNSIFDNNGTGGTNSIRARVDALGNYQVTFKENIILDASDAALSILSAGAGDGSALTFWLEENQIAASRLGADGVHLAWNGPVVGVFLNNQFVGSGGSNDGIDITASSPTDLAKFAIKGNEFAYTGGNDTGVRLTTLGPSLLSIDTNSITFDQANGVGMDFALAQSAEVYLYNNVITDNVSGGTGIRFSSITGPAEVNINANQIHLLSTTGIIDHGIVFTSITNTIDLIGSYNNVVAGATTAFFAPIGTTNGSIYVNGSAVP
jgi:hypothetical protein